jgi:predicted NUDIX family NTP pyrophosphohydrolase
MSVHSGGILLFKYVDGRLRVMLVHPGGPFWAKKDEGAWSIPKGILEETEGALEAARREFKEETGFDVDGQFIELGQLKQPGGKIVHAWALESELDVKNIRSNTFRLQWPKNSGNVKEYPEIDKAQWFDVNEAKKKILKGQAEFIDRLIEKLANRGEKSSLSQ